MSRHRFSGWPSVWLAGLAFVLQPSMGPAQAPVQQAAVQQPEQTAPKAQEFQPTPEQMGDSLMAHQRYQAAIEEYKKAAPTSISALNKMGVAYQLMFNTNDATKCYQAALKRDPKNAIAWNNMGSVYMTEKLYATAEKTYKKAVKLDPKTALFRKNMGTAMLAQHKYKKGWAEYQAALAMDPNIFSHNGNIRVENPSTIQDRGAMNFYMAKGCLKAGMTEKAIYYLRLALNEGFTTPKKILADAELAQLQDNPEFQQMMAAQGVYLNGDPSSARPQVRQ
ncbi:tetratricopeptide repeat protein [Occallatibacter riparius]|uniref:Tetratricopeptide repeat protein n=1 Tax=Occallatibacter riparius TaxID=1002689 RepID=A0A9J7BSX4_9BACT|nr:tetratricopeptide repeat protein [Occallatibacter riparius]UWZ85711.1 tetratricopeptide repeat protein [Occallatibacter riparius]